MLALVTACQTTAGGPPRDEWVKVPKDLLRLQVADDFYAKRIDALGSEAEVAWLTAKGNQKYFERLTFRGPSYLMSLHLRMLPTGWYWTVPESAIGLQGDLGIFYDWALGDVDLAGISVVQTGFPRSFYARFTSKGRDCAGVMIASRVAGLSNSFQNTIVGFLCASAGSASSLSDDTIRAMIFAVSINDPYYNGDGFSDEQIEYFKGQQKGIVLYRPNFVPGQG
ncbi:hypothetical protein EOI86_05095 [Hwanghaeella grinnelliae]|uniref:Uncharacterized protein n=1 Tax=Hwanghaeella grinnelliae TaxID=2500179 RepID=A0A437QVT8_9PROT|nr:hypothetical protein [Hwanghaeella grinnelliae]RVU38654.1 hypothetical protein EOI86_05095 [Hwanghaeella grinnelliae]